jgi:hypothetical protein
MKTSSPPTRSPGTDPQPFYDLGVTHPACGQQHQLHAQHLTVRPRVTRRTMLELFALNVGEG